MGKLKITITGNTTKEPKINEDGTVDLIIKAEMSPHVPKGLKSLGASLCLVHVSKKTWKKVSDKATPDSFYIIQGEGKSRVNKKQIPFIEIIAFDISLKESDTKAEPKTETKAEPKTEPKAEPKAEPITEAKAEPKIETKVEPKTEPNAEPKVESKTESKTDSKPKLKNSKKNGKSKKHKAMFDTWYEESDIKYVSYKDIVLLETTHLDMDSLNLHGVFHYVHKAQNKRINTPLAVRKIDDKYALVMGVKNFMISKVFHIDEVPIVEKDMTHDEFINTYKSK